MVDKVSLKDVNRFLLCGVLICLILHFAKQVLIPVCFSIFFAMLFTPFSNRIEKIGIKRGLSAFISILIIIIVTAAIGLMIYLQAKSLADKFPEIEKKSQEFMISAQNYVSQKLNVPEQKQDE